MLMSIYNEFKSSIKSPDTEEKLDLILYRPFGFLIAKIAQILKMTPSMLSIFGLCSGLLASYYYLHFENKLAMFLAGFYLVLSGIFDSADGQLARISNQSTKMGLILDGICDSIVTIAIYIACVWPIILKQNYSIGIIAIGALYFHSCQCAILDFYHREYLYFGYGKNNDDVYWNPSIADGLRNIQNSVTRKEKILNKLRFGWVRKQQFFTSRSDAQRLAMRNLILKSTLDEKEKIMEIYRRNNLWLLPWWRLIGVNAHTVLIIIFMFFHHFDLYLIIFDLITFNMIIFILNMIQKASDKKMFLELKI